MRLLGLSAVVLLVASPAWAQDEVAPAPPVLPHAQLEGNAAPTLALADAIATALARNPSALVAYAEIRRAQAIVAEVRASALPTLNGNLVYTQLDSARTFAGAIQTRQQSLVGMKDTVVPAVDKNVIRNGVERTRPLVP